MNRYALTVSYNGSHFYGWQKQAQGIATVQATLEQAISQIACEPINIIAAGRTDTGVHAYAQVIHFDTLAQRPLNSWVRGVNAHLPNSIAVLHAQSVAPNFHARFDAHARRYRYVLETAAVRSPLLIGRAGWTHYQLNIEKIIQATRYLIGKHDFSSFRAAQCQAKSPIKTMYTVQLQHTQQFIKIDFHANAFLHHMIRNIIGALIYVGSNRLSIDEFAELIAARSRLHAPPTFMPDGLYFLGADYPKQWQIWRAPINEFP